MNYNNFSVDKNGLLNDFYSGPSTSKKNIFKQEYMSYVEVEDHSEVCGNQNNYPTHKVWKKNKKSPIKTVLHALKHALIWPQFKRQLTKDGIESIGRRHSQKFLLLVLGIWLLFKFDNNTATTNSNLNYYPSSSEAILLPFPEKSSPSSISIETKAKFINRFSALAQSEMKKFGIPASIILGQAILNSNYGTSELAQSRNNFFNTTCSENLLNDGVLGNHVENNDCYIHCENAWTSFRANSLKYSSFKFSDIKGKAKSNYKLWLEELGQFSSSDNYELSIIIEEHKLYKYDK